MALHVTDTVIIGWYGAAELAAVGLGASTFFILFILGSGFGHAVTPLAASALGREDETQARRATRMGMWLSILFGIFLFPLTWFSGPIFTALGQTPEVAGLGQDFLRIAGLGMIPALLINALRGFLAAAERTAIVLWVTLAGVLLNALLNWVFVFGNWGAPELGVKGSAIASVGTQVSTAAALMAYAAWHPALRRFSLFARFWRPDPQALAQVFRLGWPIGLTGLFESGLFEATLIMMGWISTAHLAAHTIAIQLAAISFMVHLGLSNAATVRVGRALGAGDLARLYDGARVAILLSFCFGVIVVAVFLTQGSRLVSLFLDPSDPGSAQIVTLGTSLVAVAALFQLADAAQVVALGLLRGVHDTRVPMVMASISYWLIGIPVSYLLAFPAGLGGVGLWLGLVVGLTFAGSLLMWRFWRRPPTAGQPA